MKPRVVSRPVGAPRRSMTAFVQSVVPCTIESTDGSGTRWSGEQRRATPARTASDGSCGDVSSLAKCIVPVVSSTSTKSVNVPPMSTPTR